MSLFPLVSEISTVGVMTEVIVFMAQEKVLLTVDWEGRAVLFGLLLNLYRTMLNILSPFKRGGRVKAEGDGPCLLILKQLNS